MNFLKKEKCREFDNYADLYYKKLIDWCVENSSRFMFHENAHHPTYIQCSCVDKIEVENYLPKDFDNPFEGAWIGITDQDEDEYGWKEFLSKYVDEQLVIYYCPECEFWQLDLDY